MKKIIIFFVLLFIGEFAYAGDFIYPFAQVAVPKCRFSSWNNLWNECRMSIPRIENWNYSKYKTDSTYRKIYSILWWATYNYWWDVWYWSHLWVDIATSLWTPVRSIWDWEVILAKALSWWWNTVVIKHKLQNWKYIYSNYSHLSKIIAKIWYIKAWTTIWEVWSTWNSYWNHLHFQIDITSQSHPYWYTTCSKWIEIFDVVNNWLCRNYLLANTVDPILFLENNWKFQDIQEIQQKQQQTIKIEPKNIKTRNQITEEEINDFLRDHTIKLNTMVAWDNLEISKTYLSKLTVNYHNKLFSGNLPWEWLEFEYNKSVLKVFPEKVIFVDKWIREVQITWLKSGKHVINLKIWKKIIWSLFVNIYSNSEMQNPTDASIIIKNSIALWEEKQFWVVFKTKFGTKQMYIPYNWTYKIKLLSWKAKFCNVSNKPIKTCRNSELVNELYFRYEDTKNWILLFNIIPFDYIPIKLSLSKVGNKYDITWTKTQITVTNPLRFDNSYVYYNENISALKKWYLRLNKWYLLQDNELTWRQLKEIVFNYLEYEYLRSGDNLAQKNLIIKKISEVKWNLSVFDDYKKYTRWDFTKIIFDNFSLNLVKNDNKVLLDESWKYKDYITTLREKYDFRWKDQFSQKYFQPTKNITVWEALYLIEKLNSNIWVKFVYNN